MFDGRPPLTEVFAVFVIEEAVGGEGPVMFRFRHVSTAVFEHVRAFSVCFEPHPLPIVVQQIFRSIINGVLKHLNRCRIERGVHTTPFADGVLHFGNGGQAFVQCFDVAQVLVDAGVGHAGGHEQVGAFVERGHEFLAGAAPDQ